MNVEDLRAVANVIEAVDRATSAHGLTLRGTVSLGDVGGDDVLGCLSFNDGSETTYATIV